MDNEARGGELQGDRKAVQQRAELGFIKGRQNLFRRRRGDIVLFHDGVLFLGGGRSPRRVYGGLRLVRTRAAETVEGGRLRGGGLLEGHPAPLPGARLELLEALLLEEDSEQMLIGRVREGGLGPFRVGLVEGAERRGGFRVAVALFLEERLHGVHLRAECATGLGHAGGLHQMPALAHAGETLEQPGQDAVDLGLQLAEKRLIFPVAEVRLEGNDDQTAVDAVVGPLDQRQGVQPHEEFGHGVEVEEFPGDEARRDGVAAGQALYHGFVQEAAGVNLDRRGEPNPRQSRDVVPDGP